MSAIIAVIMIYKDADIVNNSINILLHCDPNCDKHGINQGIRSHSSSPGPGLTSGSKRGLIHETLSSFI